MTDIQAAGLWVLFGAAISFAFIILMTLRIRGDIGKTYSFQALRYRLVPYNGIPHCGNCGYQVEPRKDPSIRCPECGSSFVRGCMVFAPPGKKPTWFSTRMGQRRLRSGAFFALACCLGAVAMLHAWDINTYGDYIPDHWLTTVEYDMANPERRAQVVQLGSQEWRNRDLSHRARQALADRTIETVLQPGHVFNENEYTILLRGWNEGLLTGEQISEFLRTYVIMDFSQQGSGIYQDWCLNMRFPPTPGFNGSAHMYSYQRGVPSNGMFSVRYERVFIGGEEFSIKDGYSGLALGIYCSTTRGGGVVKKSAELVWNIEQHALEDGEVVAKAVGTIELTLNFARGRSQEWREKPRLEVPFEFTTTVNLKDLQAQVQANGLTQFKKVATP